MKSLQKSFLIAAGIVGVIFFSPNAKADSVVVGSIQEVVNIPPDPTGLPGVDSLLLFNLTGGNNVPGVQDSVSLTGLLTLDFSDGSSSVTSFTSLAAGNLLEVDFSSSQQITSAILTGTLDQTIVQLTNGTIVNLSNSFSVTDPFNGGMSLPSCPASGQSGDVCATGTLSATVQTTEVPEPGTLLLVSAGMVLGILLLRGR